MRFCPNLRKSLGAWIATLYSGPFSRKGHVIVAGMNTISSVTNFVPEPVPAPAPGSAVAAGRPRAGMGRPSMYSEETVGRLCEVIRRRGLSDGAAAREVGISPPTLSRWKRQHVDLEEWLAMAREQYRDAKLAIIDEATTPDGRPDWRAAAWALVHAFPQDYGPTGLRRRALEEGEEMTNDE